ncbi:hypothetical protein H5P28_06155 [Ruficoccus amylovorans]|uniref:PEP-CTERM sorting domain-containing protein n=1 Tax=Ruficoccus amylovorans TaxID=1804625 RepID=A0A842HCC1_9BACT|nr:hypothetical protein [Ruficoccus amylovorans]MBC2593839.1 hypothetical protein [Ruficoccus amylovorans]
MKNSFLFPIHPKTLFNLGQFLAAGAFCMAAGQLQAAPTTIYSDDFSDGNRDGWYNSSASAGLMVSGGQMVCTDPQAQFLLYFPDTTLAVGESLTISFDMSLASVGDKSLGLRLGVLDSNGGGKVSADGFGITNAIFEDYLGDRVVTNAGSSDSSGTRISQRNTGTSNTSPLGGDWTEFGSRGAGIGLTANVSYPVTISLSRMESSILEVSFSMNGVLLSNENTSPTNFDFDTFVLYKDALNGDVALDNFTVVYNSIPEAGDAGLLMGVIALSILFVRRRYLKGSALPVL